MQFKMYGNKQEYVFDFDLDPYRSFMRNHLKHYGYYTGRNESYRSSARPFNEWDCTHGYTVSDQGTDTEYENQAIKQGKDLGTISPYASQQSIWDSIVAQSDLQEEKRTTQLTFKYQAGKMVPKLREPRHLYAQSKDGGSQQAPRWPADIEVLPDRVCHIADVLKDREPFYKPTGYERMPQPIAEGEGKVVYNCPPTKESYFLRSRVGGNRSGCPMRAIKLKSPEDTALIFESRFESGNLMKATQVSEFEYELQLRYDLYTNKHTQWFYFRVQNMRRNIKYRFTITNFMKPGSLYNNGMRPLLYSEIDAQGRNIGWRRAGLDIKYYKNYLRRYEGKSERNFYSLTWTCVFPYDNDVCYFSHCYPYTYSDLQEYLLKISNDPVCSKFCKQRILCRSLAGNIVHVLTITSPAKNPEDAKTKKAIVLTARVHPGETNSSWMMKGFLDFLTSSSGDAKLLRDTFVFKIVPMLNPDGVIVGNYRCSLAGRDLNRNYKSVLKDSFPSVAHTKLMIKKLLEEREVAIYCDLHGHSRKQNVFIYGCDNKNNPSRRLRERIFPVIMGRNAADKFSYDICKFKVQKSKEGTGRVVIWQMGIMNSYTMEATFCGSTLATTNIGHFGTADYEALGYHFCDTILDYFDPNEAKCEQILAHLEDKLRQQILRHLERTGAPLPSNGMVDLSGDYSSDMESSTDGSDSSVDDGLPVHLIALAPKLTEKKKLKTRKERDKKRNGVEKTKEEEKKPMTPKKDSQKVKYRHADRSTLHSADKTRPSNRTGDGMPVFAQERCDDKSLKKTEYLEALTNAYLMSGVLKPSKEVPSFRYSAGSASLSASGVPMAHMEGLCPHHERALAEQYVANQLAGLSFADNWERPPCEPQSLEQPSLSPYQHRNFNNHMVTMNALQQQQRPINEYIRQAAQHITNRPQTGKRPRVGSASPIKTHPSPFDEQPEDSADLAIKRGASNISSTSPSATTFEVYDGHSYGSLLGHEKSTSKHSVQGKPNRSLQEIVAKFHPNSVNSRTKISMTPVFHDNKNPGTSGSTVDPIPRPVVSTSSTSSPVVSETGRGLSANTAQVNSATNRPNKGSTAPHTVETKDLKERSKGDNEMYRYCVPTPVTSSRSPHTSKRLDTPVSKPYRCSTEATPITDESAFRLKQRSAQSSHHFQKAQNFYSNAVIAAALDSDKDAKMDNTSFGCSSGIRPGTTENGVKGGIRSKLEESFAETQTAYRMSIDILKNAGLVSQNYPNVNNNAKEDTTGDTIYNNEENLQNQASRNEAAAEILPKQGLTTLVAENGDGVLQYFRTKHIQGGNSDLETDRHVWNKIRHPKSEVQAEMSPKSLTELRRHKSETSLRGQCDSQDHYLYRVSENRVKSASQHSFASTSSKAVRWDAQKMIESRGTASMMQNGNASEGSPVQGSEIDPSVRSTRSIVHFNESSVKNAHGAQRTTDGMLKYKPVLGNAEEIPYSTKFLRPFQSRPQTSVAGSSFTGHHPFIGQHKNATLSPKNKAKDPHNDSLCADRVAIAPQSTNKFVHVQQLAFQMRGFGIAPSGDQMSNGKVGHHKTRERAEHTGQGSGGRSEEFPCRCTSAKTVLSHSLHESKLSTAEVDSAVEFHGRFQALQKPLPAMKRTRKK